MPTIQLPDTFTATVRKQPLVVDLLKLPDNALTKIFFYGAQRIFNDAAASAKGDTPEEKLANSTALAMKKLDALTSGLIRAQRSSAPADPIAAEALAIAIGKVETAMKAKGMKVTGKGLASAIRQRAEQFIEDNPSIMIVAKKNVETVAEMALDLDPINVTDLVVKTEET